jgi:hypothetical protein
LVKARTLTKERTLMTDQIICITKHNRYSSHEAIERVGGVRANGEAFNITREECADDILSQKTSYEVQVGKNRTPVLAYTKGAGKYLMTKSDQTDTDNLLSLPEC